MRKRRDSFSLPILKVTKATSIERLPNIIEKSNRNMPSAVEMHEITLPANMMSSPSQSDLSFVARDSNHRFNTSQNTSLNTTMMYSQSNLLAPKIIEPIDSKLSRLDKVRRSLHITTNFGENKQIDIKERRKSGLGSALDLTHIQSTKNSFEKPDVTMSMATGLFGPQLKIDLTASNLTPGNSPSLKVPDRTGGSNTGQNTNLASALLKKPSHRSAGNSMHSSPMNKSIYSITIDVSKDHDQTTKELREFIGDPEDVKLIDDYIVELLGIRYRKDSSMHLKGGKDAQKKIKYMKRIVLALENTLRRKIILKILRFKKNVKRDLQLHKVIPIIEDLTDMMFITIEINHLKLFLRTLHLIAETYAMFGDFRNAIFVFNQLRLACELCDDLDMKTDALIGLGDVAKKSSQLELALMFIRRALQYAWYTKNKEKELALYDRLGIINYQMGDMERANFYHQKSLQTETDQDKNLLELSRLEIEQYKNENHSKSKDITTAFFAKLSLPSKKIHGQSPTSGGLNISCYNSNWRAEKGETTKNKKITGEFASDDEGHKKATRFSTPFPLDVLIEKILEEPEFDRVVPSPRTQKIKPAEDDIHFLQPKYHRKDDVIITRNLISINHHTKQKPNEYSFKALFGDRPPYKDFNMKIDKRLERKDEINDFWVIKNRLMTEYKTHALAGRYFFNHLSPNRALQGFKNATDYNTTLFMTFCRDSIALLVNLKFRQKEESPLLKKIRSLLHQQ